MTNNDRPDRPSPSGLAGTGAGAGRFDTRGPARTRYMVSLSHFLFVRGDVANRILSFRVRVGFTFPRGGSGSVLH
jgi:hypothetical protein